MLKKQRNAIYTEIIAAGLSPQYFEIVQYEDSEYVYELVKIRGSGVYFQIKQHKGEIDKFDAYFRYPQSGFPTKTVAYKEAFGSILRSFKAWVVKHAKDYIENEIEGVDLWSPVDVFKTITGTSSIPSEDNIKFTPQEKEHIRQSTQRFRQLVIQNFKPTKEQQQHIDSQLDYLVNAVGRLSHRDWRGVALSTLISISINLAVDTEKGRLLFKLFEEAFNQIIKALPHIT